MTSSSHLSCLPVAASGCGMVSGPPHAFFAYRGFKMFNFDFSLFLFWPRQEVFRTLVSQTGIEAMLPAVEVRCLNQGITKEVPLICVFKSNHCHLFAGLPRGLRFTRPEIRHGPHAQHRAWR